MNNPTTHIIKDICAAGGGGEKERVYLCVTIADGEAELVLEKTISQRFPVQDYDKVMDLYQRIRRGDKSWNLEEFAHPYTPQ